MKKGTKQILITAVVAVIFLVFGVWYPRNSGEQEGIISHNGIHWHPQLEVYIKGEKQEIPGGIGLIGGHNPMHTHDPDGIVHLEFSGLVREDDIRLGKFFRMWGHEFNSEQVMGHMNGPDGMVHVFVNGEENFQFENYMMQHEDKIEIRYE